MNEEVCVGGRDTLREDMCPGSVVGRYVSE